jgi:PBP1b-binding outer membrane lipoprotein LpoB
MKINILAVILVLVFFIVGCTGAQSEFLDKVPDKKVEQKK